MYLSDSWGVETHYVLNFKIFLKKIYSVVCWVSECARVSLVQGSAWPHAAGKVGAVLSQRYL